MGSSAAYNACIATALLAFYHGEGSEKEGGFTFSETGIPSKETQIAINKLAFQAEKIMHGNPSGIDNSAATFGNSLSLHFRLTFFSLFSSLLFIFPSSSLPST